MLVVDCSSATAWLMPDEKDVDLRQLAARHGRFIAPFLFWSELRNVILINERRGRLPEGEAENMIKAIDEFRMELDTAPSSTNVLAMARKHNLTVYDAMYLDLAQRKSAALATLDAALSRAAQAEGVAVA